MKNKLAVLVLLCSMNGLCQVGGPWKNPLNISWSMDGITFSPPQVFQDSAGVPSVIRWNGDTLIAAFQWFRQPNPSATWDRVATKFSYDNGLTWTQPTPIIVNGLPSNYQRPFDPTLTVFGKDSLRIYFSSSKGMPMGGLDSTVNTYSAKSADGIHFNFETNPRVDQPFNKVIDPAVIYFNNGWHYLAPIGAPQQGAYHYVSPNGLNFSQVPDIPSDNFHNWTGNYMVESSSELRFYGCGPIIWFNASPNGGMWSGYVNTNIIGGDPSVVKVSYQNYLMVYVGQPLITDVQEDRMRSKSIQVFPNPASGLLQIKTAKEEMGNSYQVLDHSGKTMMTGKIIMENLLIDVSHLPEGIYLFRLEGNRQQSIRFVKE